MVLKEHNYELAHLFLRYWNSIDSLSLFVLSMSDWQKIDERDTNPQLDRGTEKTPIKSSRHEAENDSISGDKNYGVSGANNGYDVCTPGIDELTGQQVK